MLRRLATICSLPLAMTCVLAMTAGPADAKVLLEEHFNKNSFSIAHASAWSSKYCADSWTTMLNGGVTPKSDHGCSCGSGCDFAVYTQGNNKCINSQATDNVLVRGELNWTDYIYRVRLRNDDNDTMGVVFRYKNTANYYAVWLSRDIAPSTKGCDSQFVGSRLVRVSASKGAGKVAVLASSKKTYSIGKIHLLQVTVIGTQITVHLDLNGDGKLASKEELLFTVNDSVHKAGMIGLFAYQNGAGENPCIKGGCWFDDVVVKTPEGPVVDPPLLDKDGDKVADDKDNCVNIANPDQKNYDGDAHGDACDPDADGDGLSNVEEAKMGADPLDMDTDDDGVPDGKEALPANDIDGDGKVNVQDPDSDNDGLNDGLEAGVAKPGKDTDVSAGNFKPDLDPTTHTSTVKKDTDGDGRPDGVEDANKNGRVDKCESNPVVPDSPPCPGSSGGSGSGSSSGSSSSGSSSGGSSGGGSSGGASSGGDAGRAGDASASVDGSTTGGASGGGSHRVQLKTVGEEDGGCSVGPVGRTGGQGPSQLMLVMIALAAVLVMRRRDIDAS